MNKVLWSALFALTLSACGSTGDKPATVDDQSSDRAATQTSSSERIGMGGDGVTGSALPGGRAMADPRKDPASALSRRSIHFDFDSFVVKDEFHPVLEAHASLLKANRGLSVILQGNADERGSREYNLALGQKRAEAVRKVLAVMGVSDAQMEAISFGEEKPRNPGNTEEAYAENRRTDVVYADE
jgi:peptidoglycan-associated lipoprotein